MAKGYYWMSDAEWARIEPLLPRGRKGAHRVDDRRVISGIVHMLRSGARWRDCPEVYGPYRKCPELCVSGPVHAVSDTQASKRSPNIMANWLRAANHSRTFRPSFSKLRMAR